MYAAGVSSTPGPKLSRLAALLERSPDTLAQLSRQDRVSRRQKREQKDAAAAADSKEHGENAAHRRQGKSVEGNDEAGVGSGGGADEGRLPADGGGSAALIFVAGDRSQVRFWTSGGSSFLKGNAISLANMRFPGPILLPPRHCVHANQGCGRPRTRKSFFFSFPFRIALFFGVFLSAGASSVSLDLVWGGVPLQHPSARTPHVRARPAA